MFILQDITMDREYILDVIPEANDIKWTNNISKAKVFTDNDTDKIAFLRKWNYELIKLNFI